MPALALEPIPPRTLVRPAPRIAPGPALDLPVVSFFGRSLAEYVQFFALDLPALKGRDVLDVAAGPSSFTAEACARKIDAVAADPLYGDDATALAARVESDYARMIAQMRAKRRLFRLKSFPSIAAAETDRRAAAQRFLADYQARMFNGRYVGGALPRLPFFDGTFDLVLCAHLLFIYAAQFDFDWHVAACRELVRVSAGEVRIHPLCGPDGKPYPGLARLRRELRERGIASEVRAVDYEFFAGANAMLVLRRAAP
ncbi:MAG: class I SAM-dependent methyltransferase [Opitutaceae bacterium]|nr:class I SAM-dependent methyltransferase [Opitutaceae bacterium]